MLSVIREWPGGYIPRFILIRFRAVMTCKTCWDPADKGLAPILPDTVSSPFALSLKSFMDGLYEGFHLITTYFFNF